MKIKFEPTGKAYYVDEVTGELFEITNPAIIEKLKKDKEHIAEYMARTEEELSERLTACEDERNERLTNLYK